MTTVFLVIIQNALNQNFHEKPDQLIKLFDIETDARMVFCTLLTEIEVPLHPKSEYS